MKILIIPDYYGWAFDNIAKGFKKYSSNEIIIKAMLQDLELRDFKGIDLVLIQNYRGISWTIAKAMKKFPKVIYVIWDTGHGFPQYNADYFKFISAVIFGWKFLFKQAPKTLPIYFNNVGIDTDFFKPKFKKQQEFTVGWVGNKTLKRKRFYIVEKLPYPLKIRTKKDPKEQKRSQKSLINFYQSIDVYVSTSSLEGQPLPVLEAMGCGLPVVATATGIVPEALDSEWILPLYPDVAIEMELKEKLKQLKKSFSLRKRIGQRNRKKVCQDYSWAKQAQKLDKILEKIKEG